MSLLFCIAGKDSTEVIQTHTRVLIRIKMSCPALRQECDKYRIDAETVCLIRCSLRRLTKRAAKPTRESFQSAAIDPMPLTHDSFAAFHLKGKRS